MLFEATVTLALLWLLWHILTTYQVRKRMPPGPIPLPVIGNLHQLESDTVKCFSKFREKYGNIYTLSLPIGATVVVSSWELTCEALISNREDITGRLPETTFPLTYIFEAKDVVTADYGPAHRFRKKIFKSVLHVFGSGLKEATQRSSYAVQTILDQIESKAGKPFSMKKHINYAITSQVWQWLSGKECPPDHPTVKTVFEFNRKIARTCAPGTFYNALPLLRFLPTQFKKNLDYIARVKEQIFATELKYHQETYTPGVLRDLTDSFLDAYHKDVDAEATGKDVGSIDDVKELMLDVVFGGVDTIGSTVSWFMLYILLNQGLQEKIHEEIDAVMGSKWIASLEDIKSMHYVQATVCEVMRHKGIVPSMLHNAIRDTSISGYFIPKGTPVIFVNTIIHRDPEHWPEPDKFKPERFLDAAQKFVGWKKLSGFLPFGMGLRSCPGAPLAKVQLISFTAALLRRYELALANDEVKPTLEPDASSAFVISPKEYYVVARKRM